MFCNSIEFDAIDSFVLLQVCELDIIFNFEKVKMFGDFSYLN